MRLPALVNFSLLRKKVSLVQRPRRIRFSVVKKVRCCKSSPSPCTTQKFARPFSRQHANGASKWFHHWKINLRGQSITEST